MSSHREYGKDVGKCLTNHPKSWSNDAPSPDLRPVLALILDGKQELDITSASFYYASPKRTYNWTLKYGQQKIMYPRTYICLYIYIE